MEASQSPEQQPRKRKKFFSRRFFIRTVNILSGTSQCLAGALLILKGGLVEGTSLISAGVFRIAGNELRNKEIKDLNTTLSNSDLLKKENKELKPDLST